MSPRARRRVRGTTAEVEARVADLLVQVRAEAPKGPGTYRFLGDAGTVLYVGKAKSLRTRLLSYFRAAFAAPNSAGRLLVRRPLRPAPFSSTT